MRLTLLRVALVVLVVAWIFDVAELQTAVPIWLVFLVALALELNFFAGALRGSPRPAPDRGPQPVDREELGWDAPDAPPVRSDPRLRRLLVGVGLIGALAVAIWVVDRNTGWDGVDGDRRAEATARFSAEASRVAGKPVRIRCDESGEFVGAVQHSDGVAVVGGDLAFLTPERCFDLYRLAFEGDVRGSQTGRALAVLAHEAWHLRGVRDEGATECYALQSGVRIGRRLGLSDSTARRLLRQQLTENQLRRGSALEYRVPPECRDGGGLDLDRDSDEFP